MANEPAMAHQQQRDFCLMVRSRFPQHFRAVWALDIGSLNINGSNRSLFEGSGYLGVDLGIGPNVDLVVPAHALQLPDESFDTVISTECFEHDPFYAKSLQNAVRLLKPGGLLLFTCATEGRPEHGTRRTSPGDAPLQQDREEWRDYYKTLTAADITACLDVTGIFSSHEFSTNRQTQDLYFWGIKRGSLVKPTTYSFLEDFAQRQELERENAALRAQLEESAPGVMALNERLSFAHRRMGELANLARESATDRRLWQARAEELEHMLEGLRGQVRWYEGTRSWKVTKPLRFLARMQTEGVVSPVVSYVSKRLGMKPPSAPETPAPQENVQVMPRATSSGMLVFDHPHIRIMTTKHTHFVAMLLSDSLKRWGYQVSIDFEYVESSHCGYIVICPQMYSRLPPQFAAFQMEQSVTSRWFTPKYFEILRSAEVTFDYAIENLEFLSNAGVPTWQLFYVPISPRLLPASSPTEQASPRYDFAFYGDPSAPRRRELLDVLGRHFKVVILSEVFGDELIARLREARAVINIHYYENALLETTRLSEARTLGLAVLSEGVANTATEAEFECDFVAFFKIGDAEDMVQQGRKFLERLDRLREQPTVSSAPLETRPRFAEYFERYLLYRGQIPMTALSAKFYPEAARRERFPRVCLSLPETPVRQRAFNSVNTHGFHVVQGVRGGPGWVGCAMSYKYIAREAMRTDAQYLTVCEDDVVFTGEFRDTFDAIERWLRENDGEWDVFSGLIADLHEDAQVAQVTSLGNVTLVTISHMTSTVFNVYSRRALEIISRWDEHKRDPETNTIDRYLERTTNLRVVVALPYLVGHAEEMNSTLWGFQNSQYTSMIAKSQQRLQDKVDEFLQRKAAS